MAGSAQTWNGKFHSLSLLLTAQIFGPLMILGFLALAVIRVIIAIITSYYEAGDKLWFTWRGARYNLTVSTRTTDLDMFNVNP